MVTEGLTSLRTDNKKSVTAKKWLTCWPKLVHWTKAHAKFLHKSKIQSELEKIKGVTSWKAYLINLRYEGK